MLLLLAKFAPRNRYHWQGKAFSSLTESMAINSKVWNVEAAIAVHEVRRSIVEDLLLVTVRSAHAMLVHALLQCLDDVDPHPAQPAQLCLASGFEQPTHEKSLRLPHKANGRKHRTSWKWTEPQHFSCAVNLQVHPSASLSPGSFTQSSE
eukprot:6475469-Amphidinium_carterae.5